MPQGAELRIESIASIPLYNGDDEAARGIPEPVARLKDAIAAADGLLLVTPEYNNSLPGVAKNAIDWLSRPPADIGRVFGGKRVAIAGASPAGSARCCPKTPGYRSSRPWAPSSGPADGCLFRAPVRCSTRTASSRTRPCASVRKFVADFSPTWQTPHRIGQRRRIARASFGAAYSAATCRRLMLASPSGGNMSDPKQAAQGSAATAQQSLKYHEMTPLQKVKFAPQGGGLHDLVRLPLPAHPERLPLLALRHHPVVPCSSRPFRS